MKLPLFTPLLAEPQPVTAFESGAPVGVAPFEVTSFKASLIHEGSAWLEGNFEPLTTSAGDLVVIRPGTRCSSISLTPVHFVTLHVHSVFLVDQLRWGLPSGARARQATYDKLLPRTRRPVLVHLQDDVFLRIAELYAQVIFLSRRASALRQLIVRATELIWEIEELLSVPGPQPSWPQTGPFFPPCGRGEVQTAIEIMHDQYASDLTIRDLAVKVSLSESALRRAFIRETGLTPGAHLHRMRLIKFEQLVSDSALSIAEAARAAGWSSSSHARSSFARSHGMSPSEFRAEAQAARQADWLREFSS